MNRPLQCALLFLVAASGGAGTRPVAAQLPEPATIVSGRERVAWDQELLPDSRLGDYQFAVYVNGDRVALPTATCDSEPTADGFACSAPLPRLQRGTNSLEFVAILNGHESERSEALQLELASSAATTSTSILTSTAGGGAVRVETIAQGLRSPTDLARLPDGRLLITERRGVVRIVANGALLDDPALVLDDIADGDGLGMFAVTAHPDFERTRFIYLTYTAKNPSGPPTYRVIRAREVNNTLGEVAVMLESGPAHAPAWMSARFGPDRKLYVGVAACQDCGSSFTGAVLRLNDDGSTPRDRASASPVILRDVSLPVGLSWRAGQMWVADWTPASTTIIAAGEQSSRLADEISAGAVAFTAADGTSAVLMTRPHGGGMDLYQLRGAPSLLEPAGAMLPASTIVHAALAMPDGTIYLCASRGDADPAQLIRVVRVP